MTNYHGRAQVDPSRPAAFGVCDKCGFLFNHRTLQFQWEFRGQQLQNTGMLRCRPCLDKPQDQLRPLNIPLDPPPILNARPEQYVDAETDYRVTQAIEPRITESGDNRITESGDY
jgi:hypothetical protein